MTQEDKQLLLVELCARLPHRVKVQCGQEETYIEEVTQINVAKKEVKIVTNTFDIEAVRPILRPMSSMTEEEYKSVSWEGCSHTYNYSSKSGFRFVEIKTFTLNILNWLNANHFDYRGLIEKSLAIEVTEENNPYKK